MLESGREKIAIYARGAAPAHVARQLADGKWTSKLGAAVDITHTLRGLEGPLYGRVVVVMARVRALVD